MNRRQFLIRSAVASSIASAAPLAHSGNEDLDSEAHNTEGLTIPDDLTALGAVELSQAIRQKQVSCKDVMQAYLARIEQRNPEINAIVSRLPAEQCLQLAAEADAALARGEYRGWLHGMPFAIKDLANVKGFKTTFGSPLFKDNVAQADDLFVSRIRAQGAIFIGKTNVPEWGMGSQSYNTLFGATGSATNPALTAGGSSGGAAAALGAHMLPVADGSDYMGSLRNPAAFNNIIGFRPSQGRIPFPEKSDLFLEQLPTLGPMGRNVRDTIHLLCTMAGHDSRDPMSLREPLPSPEQFKPATISGTSIGWLGNFDNYLAMEPGILALCETALQQLDREGAHVAPCQVEFDMAQLWQTWLTFRHWSNNSSFRNMQLSAESKALLKPEALWELEGGAQLTAYDIHVAAKSRSAWQKALNALFEQYDFLALPTAQVFPFDKTTHWPTSINGRKMDTYHRWMEVVIPGTLGGLPVVNVPVGFNADGKPMGMQIMGPMGKDQEVLEFALGYETLMSV